jgi:amidohydrolase
MATKKKTAKKVTRDISPDVKGIEKKVIEHRRYVHMYPERGFKEVKTQKYVLDNLRRIDLSGKKIAKTGVVALLKGKKPGKTILLRADMDALPMDEQTGLPYASKHPGVAHCCGHDSHVAMLLGVAEILSKRGLPKGTVKFCWQPAEEGDGGAVMMIKGGVLENPKPDAAFAVHSWAPMEVGNIGVADGPAMAAVDIFDLTIEGVGGHAAYPHTSIDPILVGSHVITALHSIVSRRINPFHNAVMSVCHVEGGTTFNIIPPDVKYQGTVRTFLEEDRKLIPKAMKGIAEGISKGMGGNAKLDYTRMIPATINDLKMAAFARDVAATVLGSKHVHAPEPSMGGEDFAYYLQKVPGAFIYLGAGNEKKGAVWPHHHPKFRIDEDAFVIGMELMLRIVDRFLSS